MATELDALYAKVPGSLDSVPATPEQMAPPNGAFLVVRRDGEAVACGGIKRLDAETAEVKRMYVVPAARNSGLGGALLAALEAEARRLGYLRVRLDTGPEQPAAKAVYERAGYRPIPDYNNNPYATHWFEKALAAERPRRDSD